MHSYVVAETDSEHGSIYFSRQIRNINANNEKGLIKAQNLFNYRPLQTAFCVLYKNYSHFFSSLQIPANTWPQFLWNKCY